MKNKIDLSISIVNTSNWHYLEPCLNSIIEHIGNISFEILVVDNASDDGSAEKIKKLFPDVILSTNEKKFGFAKNNNINLRKASGRYIMLLNDDTLVHPLSLENAIRFLDNNLDVGLIGCKMISPDGNFQYSSARKLRTLYSVLLSELGITRKKKYNKFFDKIYVDILDDNMPVEIDLPQESGMIFRKEIIDELGYLDEQFFMFGEGPDFCRRVKKAGWKIMYLPFCKITHYGGVTNKQSSLNMFLQGYKSTYLFFKKNNYLESQLYRFLILLLFTLKYMIQKCKYPFSTDIKKKLISEKNFFYKNVIELMCCKVNDPNYPFSIS